MSKKAVIQLLQTEDLENDMDHMNMDDNADGNFNDDYDNDLANTLVNQVRLKHNNQPAKSCFNVTLEQDIDKIEAVVSTIKSKIMGFRREKSPTIHCVINNQHVICIIDEGSVCISSETYR